MWEVANITCLSNTSFCRSSDEQTLHLYELRADSYDNLVKEADTGLTIVVLVDEASKETLVHHFAQIMKSYFRYKLSGFSLLSSFVLSEEALKMDVLICNTCAFISILFNM